MGRTTAFLAILFCLFFAAESSTGDEDVAPGAPTAEPCVWKEEGRVVIEFDLDPDGRVQNPRVIRSVPGDKFEKAALKAIVQWEYDGTGDWQYGKQVAIPFRRGPNPCE